MNAKEFLNQAYYIDKRINSKIEQVASLEALANKVTTTYSQAPASGSHNNQKMESIIIKIVTMEEEINKDIDKLLDVKAEIMSAIDLVENLEYRTVLELRYLCLQNWDDIATNMYCGASNIYRVHGEALKEFSKVYSKMQ